MYALVDCNNFYVSCERVFNPALLGKPVIVLSNNDGCAISRSEEAKALGVEMGAVPHLMPADMKAHDIKMFSSNYTLYGDMSDRVMKTLSSFVPRMEIYSIDEAFLDVSHMPFTDLRELALNIRKTVIQNTGIPVCVGIGRTKALAKMANRYAKKRHHAVGVHCAYTAADEKQMLDYTTVDEVWGIGRQYATMLNKERIHTATDFINAPEAFVRSSMSVVGLRLQKELKGISCMPWEFETPARKNICTGRSFGALITDRAAINEALSNFAANCALKLRAQRSSARSMRVFINTNLHRPQDPQYFRSITVRFETATNSTPVIIKYALKAMDIIFREGYNYMKCGVEVHDLVNESDVQFNMFSEVSPVKESKLGLAVDKLNTLMGRGSVRYGIQGFKKNYKARAAHLSPRYTTDIRDIIKIKN